MFSTPHRVGFMISEIKFLTCSSLSAAATNETGNPSDLTVTHNSYAELCRAIARERKRVVVVLQGELTVSSEIFYSQLVDWLTIIVLYRNLDVSPAEYGGFQG